MKILLLILIFILFQNCTKPKTVVICGDHICVNKTEAEQYFEENLSIEVKIINSKINKNIDLVELNLNNDSNDVKKISIKQKKKTNKKVKVLSNKEIEIIKDNIKKKKENKKMVKKISKNDYKKEENNKKKINEVVLKNTDNKEKTSNKIKKVFKKNALNSKKKNINKQSKEIIDVCTIIEKCNIDEISKYLLELGKKKSFPDITTRE